MKQFYTERSLSVAASRNNLSSSQPDPTFGRVSSTRVRLLSPTAERILASEIQMPPCRALIVEDYEEFRQLLHSLLQKDTECVVVGEACDGLQAVDQAHGLQPDLILLDLSLPKMNGMEVLRRIRKLSPNSKVVILSQDSSSEVVRGALGFGAVGYLLKSDAIELPLAVDAVLQGEVYVSSRVKAE